MQRSIRSNKLETPLEMISILLLLVSASAVYPCSRDVASSPFLDAHVDADSLHEDPVVRTAHPNRESHSLGSSGPDPATSTSAPETVPVAISAARYTLAIHALKPFNSSIEVKTSAFMYPANLFSAIGSILAFHVRNHIRMDVMNGFGGPRLDQDAELIRNGPVSRVAIGELMFRTSLSTIFAVRNDSTRVVKYSHNCGDLGYLHSLMRDYIFQKQLEGLQVAPRVMFLSPPVRFPPLISLKTSFKIKSADREACAENPAAQVRFMVMERVETSMDFLVKRLNHTGRRIPLSQCIQIMVLLIEAIQRMHDQGIIHGDVHWGNVALLNQIDGQAVVLIDFGNAMFVDEMRSSPDLARTPRTYNHCFLSHWNIEGYRFSYRDDVYKALLVGAFLINGLAFSEFCFGLESNVSAMIWFKRDEFIFSPPMGGRDHIATLRADEETKRTVKRRLSSALDKARSVVNLDHRPDYAYIIGELKAAFRLLNAVQAP